MRLISCAYLLLLAQDTTRVEESEAIVLTFIICYSLFLGTQNDTMFGSSSVVPQGDFTFEQELIPVGCMPPSRKLYVLQFQLHHQMSLPAEGSQMNKFEQVSSDHQMSLAGEGGWVPRSYIGGVPHLTFPGGVPTMWPIP